MIIEAGPLDVDINQNIQARIYLCATTSYGIHKTNVHLEITILHHHGIHKENVHFELTILRRCCREKCIRAALSCSPLPQSAANLIHQGNVD
jgi:hypothetical protein